MAAGSDTAHGDFFVLLVMANTSPARPLQ